MSYLQYIILKIMSYPTRRLPRLPDAGQVGGVKLLERDTGSIPVSNVVDGHLERRYFFQ